MGPSAGLLLVAILVPAPQAGAPAGTAPVPPPSTPGPVQTPPRTAGNGQGPELVEEVVFEGSKRLTDEALRLQVRTQKGQPYSAQVVDDDLKALAARFQVWGSSRRENLPGGGVRVVFTFEDVPTVRRVRFVGNKELDEDDLRKALGLSENGTLQAGMVLGSGLRVLVRRLEEKYQEEGYLHVEIDARNEKEGEENVLVFHILEGPEVHVDHVDFEGLVEFAPRHLRELMKTSRSFWIFTQTYKPEVLNDDVVQIEQFLKDEGYLDARVAVESVVSNPAGDTVDIKIRIEQGRRYVIRSVKLEGNEKFPTQELLDANLVKMRAGMDYRQTLYRKDRERILKYYRHRGYVECSLPSRPEESYAKDAAAVDLVIRIKEDEPKRVRDVRVTGNRNTQDQVIRRELDLHPDELFDGDEIDLATDRLRTTGFFSDEQGNPLAWVEQEKTDDPRFEDIKIRVQDGTNGIFSLFGGVASGQGVFVGSDLSIENFDLFDLPTSPGNTFSEFLDQRAFHGGGQKLHLRANPGNRYSNYLIDFSEPYLNGPAQNPFFLDLNLHLNEFVSRFYDQETTGAVVTVGKRLSRNASVSLGLRNDRIDISHILGRTPPILDLTSVEGGNSVRSLIADLGWSKFDSLRNPTEGKRADLSGELLGGPLGAQVDAYKVTATGEWLLPVWENAEEQRHVFSNRLVVAYEDGYGSTPQTPFFERYFAGGPGAFLQMRGFSYRGLGPHDQSFSRGGEGAVVLNSEYVFPLLDIYNAKLRENTPFLRGLFFVDQGMLSSQWEDLLHDRWRMSVGVGIRLKIPIQILSAPLELYYGVPVQRTRQDERESFQINFSTRF